MRRLLLGRMQLKISNMVMIMLSVIVAASGPGSVVNAQAAADTQRFTQLKSETLREIERRLDNYRQTRESLRDEVQISDAAPSIGTTSGTVDDETNKKLKLASDLKQKVNAFTNNIIEQLQSLQQKTNDVATADELQDVVNKVNEQYALAQLIDVQATVTNAVESLTAVVDTTELTYDNLNSQINKIRDCLSDSGDSAVGIIRSDDAVSLNASAPRCNEFNLSSNDVIVSAESQMSNIATMTLTIKSVLASSLVLLDDLVERLDGLLADLDDEAGSLEIVEKLSSIENVSDRIGENNLTGLMSSFEAITSQLGVVNGMSANVQSFMARLSEYITA